MQLLVRHVRDNLVAYLALFVALGGTAYAAATITSSDQLGDDVVTSRAVKNGTITGADLAFGSVGSAVIADGSVTKSDLHAASVDAGKLAPNAVTSDKIAPGSVGYGKIADRGVTISKLSLDKWHTVGAPGEVPYASHACVNSHTDSLCRWVGNIQYKRTVDGIVHIRGDAEMEAQTVRGSEFAQEEPLKYAVVFKLPAGYLPRDTTYIAYENGLKDEHHRAIQVGTGGSVINRDFSNDKYSSSIAAGVDVGFAAIR